ncbi:MAG TPA: hypothetical protein VLX09_08660 [Stellaceae bacterium]|nr:hypothetical protein [Stellaceae bacterium]
MTNFTRITKIAFVAFGTLFFATGSWAQTCAPIAQKIAKAYGLDSFGKIEQIRYTFNLVAPGLTLSRMWIWEPKADRVSFDGKDKAGNPVKVTYDRSQLGSQAANVQSEIDPNFINDQYWLVLPFHICWDTGAQVEDTGMHKLPLGKGSAKRIVVKYPSEGGYSAGDTWELFIGSNNRVQQLVYRSGDTQKPLVVIAKWSDYKKAGPLLISMDHRGTANDKPLRVYFSDVAVKLTGSDAWINVK